MHENRETSDVPASSNNRTAGEGSGRNARMYAPEESDSGIVPMSHSNKVEHSMAESEEGKAADQGEHPSTTHAPDTERGKRVTGVGGCAESSKGT